MTTYTTQYPPAHSSTYIKATTSNGDTYYAPWFSTDPSKSLTGAAEGNQWFSSNGSVTNQRFHVDLGSEKIIRRVYYENGHWSGASTNYGVQNFTIWGSNSSTSFNELTYATDTGWTQITPSQNTFDEHIGADQADPKYITLTNTTSYRYYAFKFADNYGNSNYMGPRHIELQTEDGYGVTEHHSGVSVGPMVMIS